MTLIDKYLPLCCLVITCTYGLIIRQNVIYKKTSEIGISRNTWTVALILDLKPYDKLLDKSLSDIQRITEAIWEIIDKNARNIGSSFTSHFIALDDEIKHLNFTRNRIVEVFNGYKLLKQRTRRSLLPFLGDALSWLVGTPSASDMNQIKTAMRTLNMNQKNIQHVVEESLSLINISHNQVVQNRERINKINEGLKEIYEALNRESNMTRSELQKIKIFLNLYVRLQIVVEHTRGLILETLNYMEDLQVQINYLSMGRISPALIPPDKLLSILQNIKDKLPESLTLPIKPNKKLWEFYKLLSCSAVFEDDKILIVLKVPLLNSGDKMIIYRVYNMPLPNVNISSNRRQNKYMVAQYDIESEAIAVNKAKTKYILLNKEEAKECTKSLNAFCNIKSPIYPMNVNKFCVITLFINNKKMIKRLCRTMVKPNEILPLANNISPGVWAVSTAKPLTFSISCENNDRESIMRVRPPLEMINIAPTCTANSDYLTLPPHYELGSFSRLGSRLPKVINFNNESLTLWKPLSKLTVFNKTWNYKSLKDIDKIEMTGLIDRLNRVSDIDVSDNNNSWFSGKLIIILISILIAMLLGGSMIHKCVTRWPRLGIDRRETVTDIVVSEPEQVPMTTTRDVGNSQVLNEDEENQTYVAMRSDNSPTQTSAVKFTALSTNTKRQQS